MSLMTGMLYNLQLLQQLEANETMTKSILNRVDEDDTLLELRNLSKYQQEFSSSSQVYKDLEKKKEKLIKALL